MIHQRREGERKNLLLRSHTLYLCYSAEISANGQQWQIFSSRAGAALILSLSFHFILLFGGNFDTATMVEYLSGRVGAALLPYHPDRGQEGEKGEIEEGGGEKNFPSSSISFCYLAKISSPGNNG
jgi:hypothetical protein